MAAAVADVFHRAAAVLAELHAMDLDGVDDDSLSDAVLASQQVRGRLDAAEARVLSRWDAQGAWRASGAKTGAAWLAWKQRVPIQVARQRLRHARALRTLPAIEEAWAAGDIDRAHVTTLLGARTARTAEVFDADHERLLDLARTHGFVDFKRACDRWETIVDPDGAEQGADDDRAAREVHLSRSFGGMWFGRATLDPVSGEIVDTTLRLIEQRAVRRRLGRGQGPARPRADGARPAPHPRPAPGRCPRRDGHPRPHRPRRRPPPRAALHGGGRARDLRRPGPRAVQPHGRSPPAPPPRWLTEADVERIVFDGPSRVLDVGPQRRFFTGALRRAIEVRDRTCFHPSCDEVPDRPEIDHIHEASKGGSTTQANGRLGCGFHNRWRNHHPDADDDPPAGSEVGR